LGPLSLSHNLSWKKGGGSYESPSFFFLNAAKAPQSKRGLHNLGSFVTNHHNSPRYARKYPDRVIKS